MPRKPNSLSNAKDFRINWSKPNRLCHIEEARRIREYNKKGIFNAAKLYFNRSDNNLLKNL